LLSANGIRAILFDMDGTLRHNRPSYPDTFFNIATRLGAPDVRENRWRAARWLHYYWANSNELVSDQAIYTDQVEAFWTNHARLFLSALGCIPEQAAALAPLAYQHMNEEYKPQDWVPADVPETLRVLKEAGYKLAVLSNRLQPFLEQLENLGLSSYFEFALHAGKVEAWKPDPEIFLHATDQIGAQPGEAVYVGDNYYADVIGSSRAGLIPVLIDPDGLFPEAECAVIRKIGDLPEMLINHVV